MQNKSCKFANKYHNAVEIEIFINKIDRNGVPGIGKIVDDRTLFGKVCLLLQVDMPFLYAKDVKSHNYETYLSEK